MQNNLSIVFPSLNEVNRIGTTLELYAKYFGAQVPLIVVDNGSVDGTRVLIDDLKLTFPQINYLYFDHPLGKGGAVYAGFDVAKTDLLGFTDADGSTSPEEFDKLIEAAKSADIAIASRWMSGSEMVIPQSLSRRLYGRVFNLYARLLFGLPFKDTQCGAKIIKRSVYEAVKKKLTQNGWVFDIELLWRAKQAGFTILEVPIKWRDVASGSTFSSLRSGLDAVWRLINLRFVRK